MLFERYASKVLLHGDGSAGALEGSLGLLRLLLVDLAVEDVLGSAVDQVLGLLEAQGRQGADLLDDLDLLVAGSLEDDVELVLLLNGGGLATTGGGGSGNRDGGGGLDVEHFLELLHELGKLEERQLP